MKIVKYNNINHTVEPEYVTIKEVLSDIKSDKYKYLIEKIRDIPNHVKDEKKAKEKQNLLKTELENVCFSVSKFKEGQSRTNKNFAAHSGFIAVDIDNLSKNHSDINIDSILQNDPYVYASFVSPRADGRKFLVKVPLNISNDAEHKSFYNAFLKYFSKKYKIILDENNKNVSRVTYLSYDPNLYINEDSKVWRDRIEVLKSKNSDEILASCLRIIEQSQEGERHNNLLKASRLAGGYIAGGYLEEKKVKEALLYAIINKRGGEIDPSDEKAIEDGIENGKDLPLKVETKKVATSKRKKISEAEIGKEILRLYNEKLVTYLDTFYVYNEITNIWEKQRDNFFDPIIIKILDDDYNSRYLNSVKVFLAALTRVDKINVGLDTNKISVKDGVYDINNQILIKHNSDTRKLYNTNLFDVSFSKDEPKRFLQFLDEVFEGDEDKKQKIDFLQEYLGYCLTNKTNQETAVVLNGFGSNGKSVLLNIISEIWKNNKISVELSQLSNNFIKRSLQNILINVVNEIDYKKSFSEAELKKLISGEPVYTDVKFKEGYSFNPIAKFIFATNGLPNVSDTSHGFFRRLKIINFNNTFTPEKQDKELISKLINEKNEIFTWIAEGLKRFLENKKFTEVPSSVETVKDYRLKFNNVMNFITESCEIKQDTEIKAQELYFLYKEFCEENGHKPFNSRNFKEEILKNYKDVEYKRKKDTTYYLNIIMADDVSSFSDKTNDIFSDINLK